MDDATKSKVQIGDCGSGGWVVTDTGGLMRKADGKCVSASTAGGQLRLEPCDGSSRQSWRLPS